MAEKKIKKYQSDTFMPYYHELTFATQIWWKDTRNVYLDQVFIFCWEWVIEVIMGNPQKM